MTNSMDPAVQDQTPQILVVDDEPSLRKIIARWLTEAGYACAEAAGAVAALDYLERHPVGLVTLDLTMPVQSGMQLLPQIKQRWPETEVIILTAVQETATAIEALTLGAYGYLIKPLEAEDMVLQAKRRWSGGSCSWSDKSTRGRWKTKSANRRSPSAGPTRRPSCGWSAPRATATRRRGPT